MADVEMGTGTFGESLLRVSGKHSFVLRKETGKEQWLFSTSRCCLSVTPIRMAAM
jgi:hypothetical protein